jgi:GNAT superfamily N-acetyltransferase
MERKTAGEQAGMGDFNISDVECRVVEYLSTEYEQCADLRDRELRRPLGMTLSQQERAGDALGVHAAAIHHGVVIACASIWNHSVAVTQIRQVAVEPELRGMGVGRIIMSFAEDRAMASGSRKALVHARCVVVPFYQRIGYRIEGEEFMEVGIPHRLMLKDL